MTERKLSFAARLFRRLRRDQRGNTAVVFSLVMLPVTVLVFGSIDFARATSVKANLQDALDAATIVAARTQSTNATVIRDAGMQALRASVDDFGDTTLVESSQYTNFVLSNGRVIGTARTLVEPWVAGMFLADGMQVNATAEVVRATTHVEVAMVLDVTGSMNETGGGGQTKIQRLRTAATNFINTMAASAAQSNDPNAVRIAMVPFSQSVNLNGIATRTSTWINTGDHAGTAVAQRLFINNPNTASVDESLVNRFTLFDGMGVAWGGCVEGRTPPFDVQDTPPTNAATRFLPYIAPDESGVGDGFGTRNAQGQYTAYDPYLNDYLPDGTLPSGWNGTGVANELNRQRFTGKYTRGPTYNGTILAELGPQGPNHGCVQSPVMRLTTNWTSLRTAVTNLQGVGTTNIPLGMMWGWHAVSPNAPLANGQPYTDPETTKVVVLMTDGDNTMLDPSDFSSAFPDGGNRSIYNALGYLWQGRLRDAAGVALGINSTQAQRTTAMDARLAQVCTNMRNAGIIIYTVRVEVDNSSPDTLRNCASRPDYFYEVSDASRLNDAFSAIAGSITQMRISH